jgi:hypothetical protein
LLDQESGLESKDFFSSSLTDDESKEKHDKPMEMME